MLKQKIIIPVNYTMNFIRIIMGTLLIIHGLLAVWALIGFAELFFEVSWNRVSNPLFPGSILFLQWFLILSASIIFILGYINKWTYTPEAMLAIYTAMAALCAVETFGYLEHRTKFLEMAAEYLAYILIIIFLFRSKFFLSHA